MKSSGMITMFLRWKKKLYENDVPKKKCPPIDLSTPITGHRLRPTGNPLLLGGIINFLPQASKAKHPGEECGKPKENHFGFKGTSVANCNILHRLQVWNLIKKPQRGMIVLTKYCFILELDLHDLDERIFFETTPKATGSISLGTEFCHILGIVSQTLQKWRTEPWAEYLSNL